MVAESQALCSQFKNLQDGAAPLQDNAAVPKRGFTRIGADQI
jgi:hypothetical protein